MDHWLTFSSHSLKHVFYFYFFAYSEVRVEGLETLDYLDNLQSRKRFTEQGDAVVFESEVSRLCSAESHGLTPFLYPINETLTTFISLFWVRWTRCIWVLRQRLWSSTTRRKERLCWGKRAFLTLVSYKIRTPFHSSITTFGLWNFCSRLEPLGQEGRGVQEHAVRGGCGYWEASHFKARRRVDREAGNFCCVV